jgi:hypothetical protein
MDKTALSSLKPSQINVQTLSNEPTLGDLITPKIPEKNLILEDLNLIPRSSSE